MTETNRIRGNASAQHELYGMLRQHTAQKTYVSTEKITFHVGNDTLRGRLFTPASGQAKGAVLFIHGWTDSGENYGRQAGSLAGLGYASLTFNLRGHGEGDMRSGGARDTIKPADSLADAKAAYDEIKKRLGDVPVHVVGISYGGYIASLLTKERDVESLVLSSPALYTNDQSLSEKERYRSARKPDSGNHALEAIREFKGRILLLETEQGKPEEEKVITSAVTESYADASGGRVLHKIVRADHGTTPKRELNGWFNDR